MIHVIATISLRPGCRDEFLKHFLWVTPLVRAESGCIEYGASIDEPTSLKSQELIGQDAVVVVEKWASVAALEAHVAAPHMAEYRLKVKDQVVGVSLQILKPI
jgi:quinol monooxygenase YgiN